MEDIEIINLWKSYNKKLDESLVLNRKNTEEITKLKVRSFLASMKPLKVFTILLGLLWVGFVDILIFNLFHIASPFFLISAAIQVLLTKLAIGIYLYQLILIHQVVIDAPIIETQEKVARLKTSTLWITRLLFLQLPVWTSFYWNKSMLENWNMWLYALQFVITSASIYLAVWLLFNIKFENRDKRWFRFLFNGIEWSPVIKSMELLSQIDEYRHENQTSTENSGT